MAWIRCIGNNGGGGGGSNPIFIDGIDRIIEQGWDGAGSTTYTFDEDIDDALLVLTYTRETSLTNTSYTLTLASGSYEVIYDSDVVVGSTTQERVVYIEVKGIKANDTLLMYNYGDLKTADIGELRTMGENVATGTFLSGSVSQQKVEINCGFQPDYVEVIMEFGSGYTYANAYMESRGSYGKSFWDLRPLEGNNYEIVLGSETGETGITDFTSTGFKYRVNDAPNTKNKLCTYKAIKFN